MQSEVKRSIFLVLIALLFLSSGAALLVYIFLHISLGIGLGLALGLIVATLAFRFYTMEPAARSAFARTLRRGILIGLLATAAYDVSRILIVYIFGWHINPFKAFPYFGHAIAGESISHGAATLIGTVYHIVNGVFFSVSYCLLFSGRKWFWGVFWALGLEVLMFTVYPQWLDLAAVMAEFTVVSVSGHIAYGAVLGGMAKNSRRIRGNLKEDPSSY